MGCEETKMTNSEALMEALLEMKTNNGTNFATNRSEAIPILEELQQRFKDYEDLAKLFEQAQEALEDAKERLVED